MLGAEAIELACVRGREALAVDAAGRHAATLPTDLLDGKGPDCHS